MRTLLAVILVSAAATPVSAQRPTIFDEPQSEVRVRYTLEATLRPATRTIEAFGKIRWRNPDGIPVDTLQFHLYLNAFRDANTTFMRGRGGSYAGIPGVRSGQDPMTITSLAANGEDLLSRLSFLRPDDGNPYDYTVAALKLPNPVPPGDSITLDIAFEAILPRIVARTGWIEKADGSLFFMVAQWFPKLGVYEIPGQRYIPADAPRGQWNTHQFHANSEFYADFGIYDVTINVPPDYIVGATGIQTDVQETADGKTLRYFAEDVHDFAWTASPVFREFTTTWNHVNLRLLMQPEHASQAERHFSAARIALEAFDQIVGPYPYTTLTLVDGLGQSNGMEYPTLITCGTMRHMPSWMRVMPELVTIHEFGHQYFYGMLASNEAEEAWLDEGINSYLETRIMDDAYGPGSILDVPGLRVDDGPAHRLIYLSAPPERGSIYTRSWKFGNDFDYGRITYSKSATVLRALEQYLGRDVMDRSLRAYYERWRFRHPTTRDLQTVMEEIAGEDLDWFFSQYVYGTAVVDYELADLEVAQGPNGSFTSTIRVMRLRDGTFPQVLRVRFVGGRTEALAWDGVSEEETFPLDGYVVEAWLEQSPLDVSGLNNRITDRESSPTFTLKYGAKSTAWMQYAWHILGFFF